MYSHRLQKTWSLYFYMASSDFYRHLPSIPWSLADPWCDRCTPLGLGMSCIAHPSSSNPSLPKAQTYRNQRTPRCPQSWTSSNPESRKEAYHCRWFFVAAPLSRQWFWQSLSTAGAWSRGFERSYQLVPLQGHLCLAVWGHAFCWYISWSIWIQSTWLRHRWKREDLESLDPSRTFDLSSLVD